MDIQCLSCNSVFEMEGQIDQKAIACTVCRSMIDLDCYKEKPAISSSPYTTPKSNLTTSKKVKVSEKTLQKIKNGWVAAIVSGVFTLGITLYALSSNFMDGLFNIWSMFDVVLIFALAFGIYKKSRVASTIMFLYFLASKIMMIVLTGQPSGIILSLVFLYYYFNAMIATYDYHRVKSAS